jgi:heat shock protein HslJ
MLNEQNEHLNTGNIMKFKIQLSALFLLTFSITTFAQSNSLQEKWSFLTLKENGEDIILLESSQDHYFEFAKNGSFSSSITCNNIGGKYLLGTKGRIKFNSLRFTLMACSDEKLKIEQSFSSVLKKITKYQIKDSVLTLQDERGMNVITLAHPSKVNETRQNSQSNWQQFSKCGFTFSAPKTLVDLTGRGIDSCVGSFKDENLRIGIDYGMYSARFKKESSRIEFKEETIEIDGKSAQLITYVYSINYGVKTYFSGLHIELDTKGNLALNMIIFVANEKDLETAKQIFKTIKFQN